VRCCLLLWGHQEVFSRDEGEGEVVGVEVEDLLLAKHRGHPAAKEEEEEEEEGD
jgi:hypothetical protein